MRCLCEMKLSEKNNLYIAQKKEIECLKKRVRELENELEIQKENKMSNLINEFLQVECILDNQLKIEAKKLFHSFNNYLFEKGLPITTSNRAFYSILKSEKFNVRRSTKNKVFVFGVGLK